MAHEPSPQHSPQSAEFIRSAMWLTVAVILALPVSLWWGHNFAGSAGLLAGGMAAGLCWAASLVALVVRMQFSKPEEVVVGTLGAMLARMGIVFGGGGLLAAVMPHLVPAAFWGQCVVFFLITLAVETCLAVQWVKRLELESNEANSKEQSSVATNGVKAV